ncbi:serine/threonine-protein kinase pim-2-like isoform X3 [Megalobrama amblycephala]|uniref:serine/threonine-protein kinase pim-2-like isoform X3 n=1 Tax=Megalobrama amblycephala TaxID=75352 RepID=UPI0020144A12|nr:serine/threonine-protein kinase pim-2-like isoform X3 [Megalobrama amblycephala]
MSMAHMMGERGGQAVRSADSFDGWLCPPLPGQVPVEPKETLRGLTAQGAMEASPVSESSTEKPTERRKRKRIRSFLNRPWKAMKSPFRCCCPCSDVDVVEPFVPPPDLEPESDPEPPSPAPDLEPESDPEPPSPAPDHSGVKPINEKPTERRKRKRIRSFLNRLWKAMKSPFRCCCPCSDVDVVEPFVPPPDLEPEPDPEPPSPAPDLEPEPDPEPPSPAPDLEPESDPEPPSPAPDLEPESDPEPPSPAPDHSGVKPINESFESLYNVGAMLGSGGFGRVYEGTRKFDGKKVAIKQMLKIDNDRYLHIPGHPKPLVTEVALLLMMRREPICPYVIHLYEWFEHPQTFTLVMEYPEPCESLHDFIARNPRLCEPAAQLIVLQAMMALLHCLERGVFHHDIHAENFLWNKDTFRLKLIDFGCGQLFSSDGYESKIYIGAPLYCPPEVLTEPRFHAVPTNVWALGVLLYKMVNGCLPFRSRREITQAKITFHNSTLSEGNNILAVLGGRLDPKPEVQPQPDRELGARPRLSENTRDCETGTKSSSHPSHICFVLK